MFLHITNHITTEHCVAANKKNDRFVDLEPSAGLDVAMTEFQTSVLNPTERYVVISDLTSQLQGDRAKKKKDKRMQDLLTGNVNNYSRILNGEKSLKKFQYYNDMSVGLAMLNAEKDVKTKETVAKEVLEATDKARKKTKKETEEFSKWNELLSEFKGELKNNDINKILNLSDALMRRYIRYYFQKRIVNLT